ncbi:hypothetical protein K8I61_02090, partial [bacterium]|nr:hypothetical protein [bacterium]
MNDFHTTSRDSPAGATARVTARVLARGGIARVFFGGFAVLATVGFAARGLALIDDAYITLVYARNLGEGIGPVFNAGERVEGCTAFLQMLLLAPFAMLGLDLRVVTVVVSLAALALVATLVRARILADPSTDAKATEVDRRAADFAFVAVIANPALVHYALSGMETMWYAAAVLLAVLMAERDEDATPAAAAV